MKSVAIHRIIWTVKIVKLPRSPTWSATFMPIRSIGPWSLTAFPLRQSHTIIGQVLLQALKKHCGNFADGEKALSKFRGQRKILGEDEAAPLQERVSCNDICEEGRGKIPLAETRHYGDDCLARALGRAATWATAHSTAPEEMPTKSPSSFAAGAPTPSLPPGRRR